MKLFHAKGIFQRIYRIPFIAAMLALLPFYFLAAWLVVGACNEYFRLASISSNMPDLNIDILHFYIRESIKKIYIRATADPVPDAPDLLEFKLEIDREHIASLNSRLPMSGRDFYPAYIEHDNKREKVKVHYIGDNHFHWIYRQKSWRVKTKKDKLIFGLNKINLKNPVYITTFYEALAQDMAKAIGLLSSITFPVKLYVNGVYMGVYLFQEPIEESLIRRSGRMPGSVYSGDGAPENPATGVSRLWESGEFWEKSASRSADEEQFRGDIDLFTRIAGEDDLRQFYLLAQTYLDNEAVAKYLCLDNTTGAAYHDYHHNHKIYFDPIAGKFIPIAWDSSIWSYHRQTIDTLDITLDPLLKRWKSIPQYDALRLKMLYRLVTEGPFTNQKLLERIDDFYKRVRPALAADVFRDNRAITNREVSALGMKPAPSLSFTMEEFDEDVVRFREDVQERLEFIQHYLEQSDLFFHLDRKERLHNLQLLMSGNVGRKMTGIRIKRFGIDNQRIRIYRDTNRNQRLDSEDLLLPYTRRKPEDYLLDTPEFLYTGYRKEPRTKDFLLRGRYFLTPSPHFFSYLIDAGGGKIDSVEIISDNLVTGESLSSEERPIQIAEASATDSLHPWDVPPQQPFNSVILGPGLIEVNNDLIYPENSTVNIQPGTTFKIAPGVSVFFYGKVLAKGTSSARIEFIPQNDRQPWGSMVLQGNGASGSIFEYVRWSGGSVAERNLIKYSGMVSFYDSNNTVLRYCRIGENFIGDDSVNIAYNDNFLVEKCVFTGARGDALDVDISSGKVRSSHFYRSGNDSLDFMGSQVSVGNSTFEISGDKGISVGEDSRISVVESIFYDCNKALEIKDRSRVEAEGLLIENSPIGINLYLKNWRYGEGGFFKGNNICIMNTKEKIASDESSSYQIQEVGDGSSCPFSWPGEMNKLKEQAFALWDSVP